jgi:hypothetical protein
VHKLHSSLSGLSLATGPEALLDREPQLGWTASSEAGLGKVGSDREHRSSVRRIYGLRAGIVCERTSPGRGTEARPCARTFDGTRAVLRVNVGRVEAKWIAQPRRDVEIRAGWTELYSLIILEGEVILP